MLHISEMHPMEDYIALLSKYPEIYVDNERLERAIMDAQFLSDDYKALTLLELRIESSGSYQYVNPESIIDYLEDIGVDLDKRYRNKHTKGPSLDMKKVVDPLIASGVAVGLLQNYKQFRSYKTYASFLRTMGESKKIHCKTSDGRYILRYPTTLTERDNLRVYYSDIAVVSIPKKFSNIVTVPAEGWHIAWCDYPQADWRFAYNLFIKDDKNVEVMRQCEDAYEGLARIVEGDKFDPEAFKEKRKAYKVDCLSVFYNSRNTQPIPTAMREYFMSIEKYRRYVYDLGVLYQFKLPVPCDSYFGYTQLLPEGTYPDAFISKGLNTPIQTMTSHVVNETVFGVLKKFYDLGYTEDDIRIYYVRHDELLFLFRDTVIKDAWVFDDCSQIHIDGFTPIKLDFHFGDFYQEEDADLTSRIRREADAHQDRLSEFPTGEIMDFYPVPSVESVYVQFFVRQEGLPNGKRLFSVCYYNYRTGNRRRIKTEAVSTAEALHNTVPEICKLLNNPKYLLVRNDGLEFMDAVGEDEGTLMKVISKYDSGVSTTDNGEE